MRVMRAEPARFADVTARSVGAAWRAYDLQLTTYAALLGAIGLRDGLHQQRRGGPVRRSTAAPRSPAALMWSAHRHRRLHRSRRPSTTAGSRRFAWPIYVAQHRRCWC